MSLVVMPGEIAAAVQQLHAAVMALHGEMVTQSAAGPLVENYERWLNTAWHPFYAEYGDGSWFGGAYEQAMRLQADYEDYRERFTEAGGRSSHPAPPPPDEGPSFGGFFGGFGIGAVIAAGVVLYLVWRS